MGSYVLSICLDRSVVRSIFALCKYHRSRHLSEKSPFAVSSGAIKCVLVRTSLDLLGIYYTVF